MAAARNDATSVRLVVADNGPGVPQTARAHLFEPFVSGKSTGMGLGLAVSRAIAEAHGGVARGAARERTANSILCCSCVGHAAS